MNNIDVVSLLPVLIVGLVLLIVLLVILRRIFVNVGAREIAIKERRYMGRRLPPGLWPIHPYLFRVSVGKTTVIPQGKVGIVTAADGAPLDPGRLLAKAIKDHLSYQNAELFVSSGGQRGPQVDILTPGTYRILSQSIPFEGGTEAKPVLFTVRLYDATVISENQIGLVEALDGAPLNPGDYVAESVAGHDNFQDGHEFI